MKKQKEMKDMIKKQILAPLIHMGFDHMVVWINVVKPILEKGKPIARWGHKAIPIFPEKI